MSTLLWRLCGVGLLGAIAAFLVRQIKGELSSAVRIGATVLCAALSIGALIPVLEELRGGVEALGLWQYASIPLRALGIGLLTHVCAGICRDLGEGGIGDWVEIAGKAEILLLCLPLLKEILEDASALLRMGA